jgi:hypothetical protein
MMLRDGLAFCSSTAAIDIVIVAVAVIVTYSSSSNT